MNLLRLRASVLVVVSSILLSLGSSAATAPTLVSGNFEYRESPREGGVYIAGYLGLSPDVVIPARLQNGRPVLGVGAGAFEEIKEITSVKFEEGVRIIGQGAFLAATNLSSVEFSSTIEIIGATSFSATGLTSVRVPKRAALGWFAFGACESLSSVVIEDGVKEIPMGCFQYSPALRSVEIPGSVETVATNAFQNCEVLSSVKFHHGLKGIGVKAFQGCVALEKITFPSTLRKLEDNAFAGCKALVKATFNGRAPESVLPFGPRISLHPDFTVLYYKNKEGFPENGSEWRGYPLARVPAKLRWESPTELAEERGRQLLRFGSSPVGESRTRRLYVKNVGGDVLTLRSSLLFGTDRYPHWRHFTVLDKPSMPVSLEPGETAEFRLAFSPLSAGSRAAYFRVESNAENADGSGRSYILLRGTGTAPTTLSGQMLARMAVLK